MSQILIGSRVVAFDTFSLHPEQWKNWALRTLKVEDRPTVTEKPEHHLIPPPEYGSHSHSCSCACNPIPVGETSEYVILAHRPAKPTIDVVRFAREKV